MKRSWQKATVRFPIRMSRKFWRRTQESFGEFTDENQMKDDVHYRYANGFYAAVAKVFTDADGNYNHLPADQVYPGQEGLMQGGFTSGMDMMLSYVTTFLLFAAVLLIVMIAPVFQMNTRPVWTPDFVIPLWEDAVCAGQDSGLLCDCGYHSDRNGCVYRTGYDRIFRDRWICSGCPFVCHRDDRYGAVCITILESTFDSDQPGTGAIMMLTGFALAASALGTSSFISVLVTLAFLFCRSFCGECGIFRGSIISWNYVRGISFHLPKYLRFRHIRSEVTLFRSIRWKSWLQFVSPRSVLSVLILDSKPSGALIKGCA